MEELELQNLLAPYVASFGMGIQDAAGSRFFTASCFLLEVNGHWVMCTAAHIVDDIMKLKEDGATLTNWHFNDVFTRSRDKVPYPFDITVRPSVRLRDDKLGLDYYLVYVEDLAAHSMAASGVRAFARSMIGDAFAAERLVVTGFPASYTKKLNSSVQQRHYIIGVTPILRPANWQHETSELAVFGKLDEQPEGIDQLDIGGMSGGPVLGLFKTPNEKYDVKLVAIQSGWSSATRIIVTCPLDPFLAMIERDIGIAGAR
jgi:hypothetical protein